MSMTPDSQLRIEGFRKAEASLRLEGMDPVVSHCTSPLRHVLFQVILRMSRGVQRFLHTTQKQIPPGL